MNRRDLVEWLGAANVTLVAPPVSRPQGAAPGREPRDEGKAARQPS